MGKSKRTDKRGQHHASRANLAAFHRAARGQQSTKHGAYTVIRSGGEQLPAIQGALDIAGEVDGLIRQIAEDIGGDSELTAAKRALLRSTRMALLVIALTDAYITGSGIVDRKGRPLGFLKVAASYGNLLRHNLQALGLERVARDANTLEAIAAEYAEKRTQAEQGVES